MERQLLILPRLHHDNHGGRPDTGRTGRPGQGPYCPLILLFRRLTLTTRLASPPLTTLDPRENASVRLAVTPGGEESTRRACRR